jgi:exodeoxyribonuclease-3
MKIATWNVNGIRARQTELHELLDREQPAVLCLQEIKASPDQLPVWLHDMEHYWAAWHGDKGYSGVAVLVRKDLSPARPRIAHPPFDFERRIAVVHLERLAVASIYVPNGGKDFEAKMQFLAALDAYAAALATGPDALVLCGDLNVARTDQDVHPKERKRVIGQLPEERALIERLLSRGLTDVQRALHPEDSELFTWWAPWRNMKARNIGWRLDYVMAADGLAARATSCRVLREFGTSDHGPVIAEFDPPN